VIGDVKDFEEEEKLASYFGIAPRVQRLSKKLLHEEEVADGIEQGDHRHGPQVSGDQLLG